MLELKNKIYLVGPPEEGDEYVEVQDRLQGQGHWVICDPRETPDLRLAIAELTTCDAYVMMDGWWSDVHALSLQVVAQVLHLTLLDQDGTKVPTMGLRGAQ